MLTGAGLSTEGGAPGCSREPAAPTRPGAWGPRLRAADPGPSLGVPTPGVSRDGCACTFLSAERRRRLERSRPTPGARGGRGKPARVPRPLACLGAGRALPVPHKEVGSPSPPLAIGEGVTSCRRRSRRPPCSPADKLRGSWEGPAQSPGPAGVPGSHCDCAQPRGQVLARLGVTPAPTSHTHQCLHGKGHAVLEWPRPARPPAWSRPGGLSVVGTGWVGGCRGGCSVGGEPLDRKLPSLPLLEALRASCGRAATATTEDWPAAVEFPPSNNFYKPPGS